MIDFSITKGTPLRWRLLLPNKAEGDDSFTPFAILTKGVVPMNLQKHLRITYDNYRRYFGVSYCNSDDFASYETKLKEKDNRLLAIGTVIF